MPIRFGLCSSHAPSLFQDTLDGWDILTRPRFGRPAFPAPPHEVELENKELVEGNYAPRSKRNFDSLRQQMTEFDPDVLIIVGGDQGEWFDASNMPSIMVYAGDDLWGTHNIGAQDDDVDPTKDYGRFNVNFKVDKELGRRLLDGLVKEGFDVAISTRMEPQGRPARGLPHAFVHPAPWIMHRPDLPIVPVSIMTTERTPATLTGERCVALGRAIAKVCEDSPKRIAIYGSGGLYHSFTRRGWVDEPMDNWFLDRLTSGGVESFKSMFRYRSINTMEGTGEDRTWIVTAAALDYVKPGHKGVAVDYFPARKGLTGVGWLYYPPVEEPEPVR